jgi:putative aldouronate transport system permease protein
MMKRTNFDKIFNVLNIVFLVLVAVVTILPLYYIVIISITDPAQYMRTQGKILFPSRFSFDAYKLMIGARSFKSSLMISGFLVTVGTALSLIVTTSFAYGISKKRLLGRKVFLFLVLFAFLFNPGIIPNYLIVRGFKLIDSIWSLILPSLARCFYMLLMKSFFENLPQEIEESAKIEGCSDLGIFFKIIIPISYASLAAFGLFYAVNYWNSYFDAIIYINSPEKWPLQMLIRNLVILSSTSDVSSAGEALRGIPSQSIKMATVVMGTLPILIVYPFVQKYFTKGVMLGSVKG